MLPKDTLSLSWKHPITPSTQSRPLKYSFTFLRQQGNASARPPNFSHMKIKVSLFAKISNPLLTGVKQVLDIRALIYNSHHLFLHTNQRQQKNCQKTSRNTDLSPFSPMVARSLCESRSMILSSSVFCTTMLCTWEVSATSSANLSPWIPNRHSMAVNRFPDRSQAKPNSLDPSSPSALLLLRISSVSSFSHSALCSKCAASRACRDRRANRLLTFTLKSCPIGSPLNK